MHIRRRRIGDDTTTTEIYCYGGITDNAFKSQQGKKVIILLNEYDTPMQEAYVNGFWDE